MRRPAFFAARQEGVLARLALAPLVVASWIYEVLAALHRMVYERGIRRSTRLACRVVSVGNLSVGGTGKTPVAGWLAAALQRRGYRVVLASRGYGRLGRERVEVVSDGRFVRSNAQVAGDEPMLLAAAAPGVPVLVGRHRDLVGLRAVSAFGAQVLVLDDGFQHHRLARDVDLVLIDGRTGLGNGRVLPRGPLRERLAVLGRADVVAVVDGPLSEPDHARVQRYARGARRVAVSRRPAWLRPLEGSERTPPASLRGQPVGMLCGIAGPEAFRATLEALGARVVAERLFPDHHAYREADLRGLAADAPLWVTTEKDAVKLLPRWLGDARLRVLGIEVEVERAEDFLDWLEGRLRARPSGRDAALPLRAASRSRASSDGFDAPA